MPKITPNSTPPVASHANRERTNLEFFIDAVTMMSLSRVIDQETAGMLFDRIEEWSKTFDTIQSE